jgi:hypothetical protein
MGSKLDMEASRDHQVEEMELLPKEGGVVVENELFSMLVMLS